MKKSKAVAQDEKVTELARKFVLNEIEPIICKLASSMTYEDIVSELRAIVNTEYGFGISERCTHRNVIDLLKTHLEHLHSEIKKYTETTEFVCTLCGTTADAKAVSFVPQGWLSRNDNKVLICGTCIEGIK
jgi:hypothetical protein